LTTETGFVMLGEMRAVVIGRCVLFMVLLAATAPARTPHPEPRVIVNVLSVNGPHDRDEVQRAARNAWGRIVSCYKSFGQRKRGSVELQLGISSQGRVTSARHTGGSLESSDLAACLVGAMKRTEMPPSRARSTAVTEFQLGPGDAS
jgi:hypothetical protein